jgi:SAM-dependent methyltransferase
MTGPSDPYADFARSYDWLATDGMMSGEHLWRRFGDTRTALPAGARVLDCACGTGCNAAALARRGFTVTAADASEAMLVDARRRMAGLAPVVRCSWLDLPETFPDPFDAVVCTGNSLIHAADERSRIDALSGMAAVLRPGALLLLDSRNWEAMRRTQPRLQIPHPPVVRDDRAAVAVYAWNWRERWDAEHRLEIVVVCTGRQATSVVRTQITFRPFRFEDLTARLRQTGFENVSHTFSPDTDFYDVTARRLPEMRTGGILTG